MIKPEFNLTDNTGKPTWGETLGRFVGYALVILGAALILLGVAVLFKLGIGFLIA